MLAFPPTGLSVADRNQHSDAPVKARHGLVIDLFAGGGGASTGIERAIGRPVDIAINHNAEALALHAVNHPHTKHYCANLYEVDPHEVVNGRSVDILWASPDCRHFSRAKGAKPVSPKVRSLAWVVVKWAKAARPNEIYLENVPEFSGWGPLDKAGLPIKSRKGETFRLWIAALRSLGYVVDTNVLIASDLGAPTIRKRFFLVARRDGLAISWPQPTHGDPVRTKNLKPWRTAADCVDFSIPCPSIFERKKPLADATLRRIVRGVYKFAINSRNPFVVIFPFDRDGQSIAEPLPTITAGSHLSWQGGSGHAIGLCVPTLVQTGYGERAGQHPRAPGIDKPLGTVVAGGTKHAVVAAFLSTYYGTKSETETRGSGMDEPIHTQTTENRHAAVTCVLKNYGGVTGIPMTVPTGTVTSIDHHSLLTMHIQRDMGQSVGHSCDSPLATIAAGGGGKCAVVASHVVKLRGDNIGHRMDEPVHTITAGGTHLGEVRALLEKYGPGLGDHDGLPVVMVHGQPHVIVDIGLRMFQPRELFRAQGFEDSYVIDVGADGKALTKDAQVRLCGNSVPPPCAEAVVACNHVGCCELQMVA